MSGVEENILSNTFYTLMALAVAGSTAINGLIQWVDRWFFKGKENRRWNMFKDLAGTVFTSIKGTDAGAKDNALLVEALTTILMKNPQVKETLESEEGKRIVEQIHKNAKEWTEDFEKLYNATGQQVEDKDEVVKEMKKLNQMGVITESNGVTKPADH